MAAFRSGDDGGEQEEKIKKPKNLFLKFHSSREQSRSVNHADPMAAR